MKKEALDIIERIGNERNISTDVLYEALEAALVTASKKVLGQYVKVSRAEVDAESGEFRVYAHKTVVDVVEYPEDEIGLEEAREIQPDIQIGDILEVDVTPEDFGRIAAQSAKQVVTQKLREAERVVVYEKFQDRVGELIYGTVHRYESRNVIVDIGTTEAILPQSEQAFGERYRYGDKIRAYIMEVRESSKEPQIVLSRRCPEFLKELFRNEVPEIAEGIVTIRAVAREAGRRSKIAVSSNDTSVDPVGACVGVKGCRVQMVVQELRGERIDIVEYSDDSRRFVANSLKPAEVMRVRMVEDEEGNPERATLVVRDDQLSLAIGKGGLNVTLAAKLTKVPIDIVSEAELQESEAAMKEELLMLETINDEMADALMFDGLFSVVDILEGGYDVLIEVPGMTPELAEAILNEADELYQMALEGEEGEEGEEEPETAVSVQKVQTGEGELDSFEETPTEEKSEVSNEEESVERE